MKLTITRHGETEENVKGIFQGHLPGTLTEKGKEQAQRLAERLKNEKFDIIFSSDLARASDTAKEIAKFHPDTPIYFIEELRERFMGKAEGKSQKELGWNDVSKRSMIMKEFNAEKIPDFEKRAKNLREKLSSEFLGKNVLLVGHVGIDIALMANIFNQSWLEFFNSNPFDNTAITIFELDKNKKPKLVLMNCTKHLEDLQ